MKAECSCCGLVGEIETRGLCGACRKRCRRYGTLRAWGQVKADRRREYAAVRALGWSLEYAAWSAGVSVRTAWRYEAELRDARSAGWPATREAAA